VAEMAEGGAETRPAPTRRTHRRPGTARPPKRR
jgi:hypothetical protein